MKVIWSASARRDVICLLDRYQRIDAELALLMAFRIDAAPNTLLHFTGMGTRIRPKRRKWNVDGTSFVIVFARTRHRLEVKRVFHERENWPGWP